MTTINEILTLNLQEDIKNVIDLEDRSENEIQQEIEAYIVTEGIGRHLYNFTNQFTSNIKETGVWLSGFYGSGKSYFGKMLGYIVDNPVINGTSARERFIPRLKGISDESLIENAIRNLESIKSRVIFLDVAKQNTDKGLAFTLFTNFLKNLGFRDDIYGYMEFELYIDGKYDEFKNKVKELEGQEWDELKISNRQVAKVMRTTFKQMGYSEDEYQDTYNLYSSTINEFSASKLKIELEKYLKFQSDETLVFIFDEASEAISQKKFTLLDLEGISEAFSSINGRVWTIAIAQEKLDDVINNTNVNRSQLTKVTDRFKIKINLEATEVDIIIRSRLLQKKTKYNKQLIEYYKKNEGLVLDATNLKSTFPTKTTTAEDFAIYYPFHKYQFDILQKFLFSSNALVATQIAARGMIITTFDVLRKQMLKKKLYDFTTGYAICSEAQTAPPVELVNRYDSAYRILENKSEIDGRKLLKTIHLLSDSEVISPTSENITKSYISDITKYYNVKPTIENALNLLVESKVLLVSNNNYKITSDLERKLLDEMRYFTVELYKKKRSLINYIKSSKIFFPVATYNDGTDNYKFSILSDQDDELTNTSGKQLKLIVYSLFNIHENRQDFIEQIKLEKQYNKDLIVLVPDNSAFAEIDKLIEEINRYLYIEENNNAESDSDKRKIIRDFAIIREEKEKDLRIKIENAYKNSSLIYMFDEYFLNSDTFKGTINDIQRKLVSNIYTKKLSTQLSEGLIPKIFKNRKEDLSNIFSGEDFRFFDTHGNFIGDNLKVVEEINSKIQTRNVDGRSLESELSEAPWGYSFGTIASTLATLFRAGRLTVKYNGNTWSSHEQKAVHEAFTNATKFKTASFKSITATLTASQKNKAVQILMDLEIEQHIDKKVDWNINDFDLANAICDIANRFIELLVDLRETVDNFGGLFPNIMEQEKILQNYTGKITENNYLEKVEYFLETEDIFREAIQIIIKSRKFIKNNLKRVIDFKTFIESVLIEIKKADKSDDNIYSDYEEFQTLYRTDIIKNFSELQQKAQLIKDSYFKLIKNSASALTHEYQKLSGKVEGALHKLKQNYPLDLNTHNLKKLEELKSYCSARIIEEPHLNFSITCDNCGYSLSDILNYTALAPTKENELVIIESNLITKQPQKVDPSKQSETQKTPRKVKIQVPRNIITVREYKTLLTNQLMSLAGAQPDEEIELEID